jgi:CAAX prenyl protease-like protein
MQSSETVPSSTDSELLNAEPTPPLPRGIWGRVPGLTYVLPFVVYMLVGMFEPSRPDPVEEPAASAEESELNAAEQILREQREEKERLERAELMPYEYYPYVYTTKIVLTVAAMLFVLPGYLTWRPLRINAIAVVVGAVGVVAWIGVCKLDLEQRVLVPMGLGSVVGMGARPGFNPLEQLKDDPTWAYGFLAIRLFGLALIVPIIEEFFTRGFLVRFVMDVDWFRIPFGKLNRLGLITSIGFPMLMHPGELFAAFAWFGLITWLMVRTRNIWDCVAAHAVTNALLGAYVLATGEWQFM